MFSDPIGDSLFGSEALDYFPLTIRPKNVHHRAESDENGEWITSLRRSANEWSM
jgi:hypothetical protein